MEKVYETVLGILRESLFGEPFDKCAKKIGVPDEGTVSEVFSELQAQTVLCLADKWIAAHRPSSEALYQAWCEATKQQQLRTLRIMAAQQKLVELLDENKIEFAVIKGAAAAVYYPDPFLRTMGDVDVLVKREDFERTAHLMEKNGFISDGDAAEGAHYHSGYNKYSVCFELHRRLPLIDERNEEVLRLFEDGIENRVKGSIACFSFPMLPPKLNGLVLLLHIDQHLRVGLGLRQIIDWMMFVERNIDDAAWENDYRELFEKHGMRKFAKIVTEMCKIYLGLRGDITWCSDADHDVCAGLMSYIIEKGNFGAKAGEKGHVSSVFLRSTNPIRIAAKLQKKGLEGWTAAKRHTVLRPFAWLYELKNTIKKLKRDGITVSDMHSLKNEGLHQRRFIESLGLGAEPGVTDKR